MTIETWVNDHEHDYVDKEDFCYNPCFRCGSTTYNKLYTDTEFSDVFCSDCEEPKDWE